MNARRFHVYAALEGSLGLEAIREALPTGTPVRAVSLAEAGLAGSEIPSRCRSRRRRLLRVPRPGARGDRGSERPAGGPPGRGALPRDGERVPPAGVRGRRRRPGRAAAVRCAARVRAREGTRTSSRLRCRRRRGRNDHRPRPEGRDRQDDHVLEPRGRAGARGQVDGARRSRPPVRRRRARARPGAEQDDLSISRPRAERSTRTRSRASSRSIRPGRGRCSRRCGRTRRPRSGRRSCARSSRSCARGSTSSSWTRRRRSRAEVIAAVDVSSHLCVVGMLDALSLKDTKIGLETLEQMGYDPNAVTFVLNRADSDVGITASDVEELLGRAPDVLVGSDRAIPRALTSGQPIVVAEPKSKAARSYGQLAERYLSATALPLRPHRTATVAAGGCCGRRANDGAARAHRGLAGDGGSGVERQRERPLRGAEEPDPSRARQRARAAPVRRGGRRRGSQPRRVRDRRPARAGERAVA